MIGSMGKARAVRRKPTCRHQRRMRVRVKKLRRSGKAVTDGEVCCARLRKVLEQSFAQNRCCVPHLIARIYSEPANSEITGTFSRKRPRTSNRPTRGTGVLGCRKSNGSIRTTR
jgi:hypothetical protein